MSEVVSCGEVAVNGRAVWRAGAVDDSNVMSTVIVTPTTSVVPRSGKTDCCWAGTCRLHCGGSRSKITLIVLGLLAVAVLLTVAVIGFTWTAAPLTVNFNGNPTAILHGTLYNSIM